MRQRGMAKAVWVDNSHLSVPHVLYLHFHGECLKNNLFQDLHNKMASLRETLSERLIDLAKGLALILPSGLCYS